jgi:hypothetical protein
MFARKKKPEVILHWHPNFRMVASLPDIKQVRTGFIINFIAIFLAVVALGWTLYVEVQIHKTNTDLDHYNAQITGLKPTNDKDLGKSAKFVKDSKPLQFTARFFSEKLPPLDVMASLLEARPANIYFDSVDLESIILDLPGNKKASTQRITIMGTLNSPREADLDPFMTSLQNSPLLKSRITGDPKDFKLDYHGDPAVKIFSFTLTITLKPPA